MTKSDLREELRNLATKEDFNNVLTAVDAYAKKTDTYFQEMRDSSHRVDHQGERIQRLVKKLGARLEY